MSPATNPPACATRAAPRVLVVDDEPGLLELVTDVVGRAGNCQLLTAGDLRQAEKILASEEIDLLLTDVYLPDGNGMSLLSQLHDRHPRASAVVITGSPSVTGTISAFRAGVADFLLKPFSADLLLERINTALDRQANAQRGEMRMARLRGVVKKLNLSRHTISKKVDLLCNDLVAAYGELSRQVDTVRMQEGFRRLLGGASDLEQLLCHAMDWILRHAGYCNVAVWLAAEDQQFELGAYMKYTIPGEPELTSAMRLGLVPMVNREGSIHLFGSEVRDQLTPAEYKLLAGQEILGINCTYLGESLAAVVMFRDEKAPFTDEDVAMIRAISPIFAVALANMVRRSQDPDEQRDEGSLLDDDGPDEKKKSGPKPDADWWKRGEPPPF